jgi:hypothetical protein
MVALGAFSISLVGLVVCLKLISKDSDEPDKIPMGRSVVERVSLKEFESQKGNFTQTKLGQLFSSP